MGKVTPVETCLRVFPWGCGGGSGRGGWWQVTGERELNASSCVDVNSHSPTVQIQEVAIQPVTQKRQVQSWMSLQRWELALGRDMRTVAP